MHPTCYLCGTPIMGHSSYDHVPPKQFFPDVLKKAPNLVTLPTHEHCNKEFQRDEDYFRLSLGPLAMKTTMGSLLWKDIARSMKRKAGLGLVRQVYAEFQHRTPGGIYYPPRCIAKHYDAQRITRVAWKIIRGLHCHTINNEFVPENAAHYISLLDPAQPQADFINQLLRLITSQEEHGHHPRVLAYKFKEACDEAVRLYAFGIRLWEHFIFLAMYDLGSRVAALVDVDCPAESGGPAGAEGGPSGESER
ncbi:MAG: hypothetical protein HY696_09735 [Deltaproteobacteria bacterium]|nr:hypothetical protein [Deltaproteobacteria bacterium]